MTGIALAAATPGLPAGEASPSPPDRPNIVIILIDTLRADHLSFYGYERNTSPFLSTLAEKSVVFENAYSTAPLTAPATASLFTSLYPEGHGVILGQRATSRIRELADPKITLNRIPDAAVTPGEVMKSAGYSTFGVSDNYNASDEMGFAQGFDRFESNPTWYWGAERINEIVLGMKEEMEAAGPYFFYIHYIDPNAPYHQRSPWYVKPEPIAPAEAMRTDGAVHRRTARAVAKYDSEIGYVDHFIEKLYRIYGWDRETLLIVTSDHGEGFNEHGDAGHGKNLYDEVL